MIRAFITVFSSLVLVSCLKAPESQTAALPFACGPQNASEIYFDKSQLSYLSPFLKQEGPLKELVVFGGSFSDSGVLGSKTIDGIAPLCVYWNHRFSNGPNWNDYIAGGLKLEHHSYAVGGAEALRENTEKGWAGVLKYLDPLHIRDTAQDLLLSAFPIQVDQWAKDQKANPKDLAATLFVIWVGPNDYLYHGKDVQDKAGQLDPIAAEKLVQSVLEGIKANILRLQNLGAQHIVLGNSPRLNDFVAEGKDPISPETYAFLNGAHNEGLKRLLDEMAGQGLDIHLFHAFERNEEVLADLQAFGFDDPGRCYYGSIFGYAPLRKRRFCPKPLRTKLWDDMHPNTRMHCLLAEQFLEDVGSFYGWSETASVREACLKMRTKSGEE